MTNLVGYSIRKGERAKIFLRLIGHGFNQYRSLSSNAQEARLIIPNGAGFSRPVRLRIARVQSCDRSPEREKGRALENWQAIISSLYYDMLKYLFC